MLKKYLLISGIIFGAVAILHLIRAIMNWHFIIGTWPVPEWMSYIAFIAAGVMCVVALKLFKK